MGYAKRLWSGTIGPKVFKTPPGGPSAGERKFDAKDLFDKNLPLGKLEEGRVDLQGSSEKAGDAT